MSVDIFARASTNATWQNHATWMESLRGAQNWVWMAQQHMHCPDTHASLTIIRADLAAAREKIRRITHVPSMARRTQVFQSIFKILDSGMSVGGKSKAISSILDGIVGNRDAVQYIDRLLSDPLHGTSLEHEPTPTFWGV